MAKKKIEYVCKIVNSQFATSPEEAAKLFLNILLKYQGREIPVEVKEADGSNERTIQTYFGEVKP